MGLEDWNSLVSRVMGRVIGGALRFVGRWILLLVIMEALIAHPWHFFESLPVQSVIFNYILPVTPLLLLRRWIIRPRFPFLRWGYVFVAVYGCLMAVFRLVPPGATFQQEVEYLFSYLLYYEPTALAVTVIYAWLEPRLGLGDKAAPAVTAQEQGSTPPTRPA